MFIIISLINESKREAYRNYKLVINVKELFMKGTVIIISSEHPFIRSIQNSQQQVGQNLFLKKNRTKIHTFSEQIGTIRTFFF